MDWKTEEVEENNNGKRDGVRGLLLAQKMVTKIQKPEKYVKCLNINRSTNNKSHQTNYFK